MDNLGIGSYTYPWTVGVRGRSVSVPLSARELMERAVALEVGVVQYCDNLPLTRQTAEDLDAIEALAKANGIRIEIGTRGLDSEEMGRCAALAERFRAPFVRLVTDLHNDPESGSNLAARIRPLLNLLPSGVKLAIENHDSTPARLLRQVVEDLGPERVGICLDTANSLGALEGLDTVVRELGPFTVNLHIKDVRIYRVWHQMGFEVEGTPAGQGMVPIPDLLQQLRAFGFHGTVILEHWPAPLEDEQALRDLEERWTRESLAYMRPLLATDR